MVKYFDDLDENPLVYTMERTVWWASKNSPSGKNAKGKAQRYVERNTYIWRDARELQENSMEKTRDVKKIPRDVAKY